jgi:hypothetical protein
MDATDPMKITDEPLTSSSNAFCTANSGHKGDLTGELAHRLFSPSVGEGSIPPVAEGSTPPAAAVQVDVRAHVRERIAR